VAQWLALLPHSARDPGSIPASDLYLCRVCTLSVSGCFLRVLQFPTIVRKMYCLGALAMLNARDNGNVVGGTGG